MSDFECPESVTGHAQNDRSGKCCWCGKQIDPPVPRSNRGYGMSELTDAYNEFYDPDYGALTPAQIAQRYRMGQ